MSGLLIPYAADEAGEVITVDEAKAGQRIECLDCGEELLVRAAESATVSKHFAHYPHPVGEHMRQCAATNPESAQHLFAKAAYKRYMGYSGKAAVVETCEGAPYSGFARGRSKRCEMSKVVEVFRVDRSVIEDSRMLPPYRIDVAAYGTDENGADVRLALEMVNTSPVSDDKRRELAAHGIQLFEIDCPSSADSQKWVGRMHLSGGRGVVLPSERTYQCGACADYAAWAEIKQAEMEAERRARRAAAEAALLQAVRGRARQAALDGDPVELPSGYEAYWSDAAMSAAGAWDEIESGIVPPPIRTGWRAPGLIASWDAQRTAEQVTDRWRERTPDWEAVALGVVEQHDVRQAAHADWLRGHRASAHRAAKLASWAHQQSDAVRWPSAIGEQLRRIRWASDKAEADRWEAALKGRVEDATARMNALVAAAAKHAARAPADKPAAWAVSGLTSSARQMASLAAGYLNETAAHDIETILQSALERHADLAAELHIVDGDDPVVLSLFDFGDPP